MMKLVHAPSIKRPKVNRTKNTHLIEKALLMTDSLPQCNSGVIYTEEMIASISNDEWADVNRTLDSLRRARYKYNSYLHDLGDRMVAY